MEGGIPYIRGNPLFWQFGCQLFRWEGRLRGNLIMNRFYPEEGVVGKKFNGKAVGTWWRILKLFGK